MNSARSAKTRQITLVRSTGRLRLTVMLVIAAAYTGGCGTFSHENTPRLGALSTTESLGERPYMHLNVQALIKKSGAAPAIHDAAATAALKIIVAKTTEESALFERYSMEHSERQQPDLIVSVQLLEDFNDDSWARLPLAFWQGAAEGSLWVIPFPATIRQRLTTQVTDREGKHLKTYDTTDGVTAWLAIWSLPFTQNQMQAVVQENWRKMLLNTYQMMINDGILRMAQRS